MMINKKAFFAFALVSLFLVLLVGTASLAAMSSAHYSIDASVFSGGGMRMESADYVLTGTLGQPSPLGMAASDNFELRSGFWESASRLAMRKLGLSPAIYLLLLGD